MRPMARAIVAPVVSLVGDGDTPQVRADSNQDEPLGELDSFMVMLLVSQSRYVNGFDGFDLILRSMPDEKRFSLPLEDGILPFRDRAEIHLNLGQRQHISRGSHGGKELGDRVFHTMGSDHHPHTQDGVGSRASGYSAVVVLGVFHLIEAVLVEVWRFDISVGATSRNFSCNINKTTSTNNINKQQNNINKQHQQTTKQHQQTTKQHQQTTAK